VSISTDKHGLLYCPHGLRPFHDPPCPACLQDQRDEYEAIRIAADDPLTVEEWQREFDDWYASRDMVHALHGDEGRASRWP
jgi:hypothetical protein